MSRGADLRDRVDLAGQVQDVVKVVQEQDWEEAHCVVQSNVCGCHGVVVDVPRGVPGRNVHFNGDELWEVAPALTVRIWA